MLESGCVGLLFYWGWRYLPIPLLTDDKKGRILIEGIALSAFLDLFLAVYPATVLHRLQMNRKKKIGLMIILGMGILYAFFFYS